MNKKNSLRLGSVLLLVFSLLISFQNCTPKKTTGEIDADSLVQVQGGDGYSGMQTFQFDSGVACSDGHPRSVIKYDTINRLAYLIRDNCLDIPNGQLEATLEFTVAADLSTLIFNGLSYVNLAVAKVAYNIVCSDTIVEASGAVNVYTIQVQKIEGDIGGSLFAYINLLEIAANGTRTEFVETFDQFVEENVTGVKSAGGVDALNSRGFKFSSLDANAFTDADLPVDYQIESAAGTGVIYANQQLSGNISQRIGPKTITCGN